MAFTGEYLGVQFIGYHYEPTKESVNHYLEKFAHKYKVGQNVRARAKHRKSFSGSIVEVFYSTDCNWERCGCTGGTIKGYYLQNDPKKPLRFFHEGEIKEVISS